MSRLSSQEKFLFFANLVLLLSAIIMSIFVGFMLPKHLRYEDYVDSASKSEKQIAKLCKCFSRGSVILSKTELAKFYEIDNKIKGKHLSSGNFQKSSFPASKSDTIKKTPSFICGLDQASNFLLSAFFLQYSNNEISLKFSCTGFIISSEWAAVSKYCVPRSSQWTQLKLRSNSEIWDNGGHVRNVVGLGKVPEGKLHGLQLLKVDVSFDDEIESVKFVKIYSGDERLNNKTDLYSVGWSLNSLDSIEIERWTTRKCKNCLRGILTNRNICSENIDGRPLVTADRVLVGYFKSCNCSDYPERSVFGTIYETEEEKQASDIEIFRVCKNKEK